MSTKKYSKNNLIEVIFQIKFEPILQLYADNKEAASDFQKVIRKDFPHVEFQHENKVDIKISKSGTVKRTKSDDKFVTWIFSNKTKSKTNKKICLNAQQLTLSYSGEYYHSFKQFKKDVEFVLEALNQYSISEVDFIGLRYVNQIKIKDFYINPNLHIINEEFEKNNLIESLNRTELKIDDYTLAFQFGQFNPEYPSFTSKKEIILDYDCELDDEEKFVYIPIELDKMHEIILNRFEHDIRDKLRQEME